MIDTRRGILGNIVFVYVEEIHLSHSLLQIRRTKMLQFIDEIVRELAHSNDFENTFYLWDRSNPDIIQLITRSEYELDTDEVECERKKFQQFREKIECGFVNN